MKLITPLFVRLLVLFQQFIHGCLALRLMTGMPISALKCNLQRQRFCAKPSFVFFFVLPLNSCETASSWTEVPNASYTDSDRFCSKVIKSSLRRDLVEGHFLKFCVTNSVDTTCKTKFPVSPMLPPQASRGSEELAALYRIPKWSCFEASQLTEFSDRPFSDPSNDDNGSLSILKVCSALSFLALTVVVIVLVYFVKKKVRLASQC